MKTFSIKHKYFSIIFSHELKKNRFSSFKFRKFTVFTLLPYTIDKSRIVEHPCPYIGVQSECCRAKLPSLPLFAPRPCLYVSRTVSHIFACGFIYVYNLHVRLIYATLETESTYRLRECLFFFAPFNIVSFSRRSGCSPILKFILFRYRRYGRKCVRNEDIFMC